MIGGEWKWAGGDRQNAPLVSVQSRFVLAAADIRAVVAPEGTRGKPRRLSRPMIDELGSTKSECRPVLIYRN